MASKPSVRDLEQAVIEAARNATHPLKGPFDGYGRLRSALLDLDAAHSEAKVAEAEPFDAEGSFENLWQRFHTRCRKVETDVAILEARALAHMEGSHASLSSDIHDLACRIAALEANLSDLVSNATGRLAALEAKKTETYRRFVYRDKEYPVDPRDGQPWTKERIESFLIAQTHPVPPVPFTEETWRSSSEKESGSSATPWSAEAAADRCLDDRCDYDTSRIVSELRAAREAGIREAAEKAELLGKSWLHASAHEAAEAIRALLPKETQ